jgi:hypothetical protein
LHAEAALSAERSLISGPGQETAMTTASSHFRERATSPACRSKSLQSKATITHFLLLTTNRDIINFALQSN